MTFQEQIKQGIPSVLPQKKDRNPNVSHAPKRKEILSEDEKKLTLKMHCVISNQKIMLN